MAECSWDEIVALLKGAPPAHLATSSATAEPHVSIVMPGVDGDRLWVVCWRRSATASDLAAGNPRVALVWSANAAETYVWGQAEEVADPLERGRLWAGGILPYDPAGFFGPVAGDSVAFRNTPPRATAKTGSDGGPRVLRWSAG